LKGRAGFTGSFFAFTWYSWGCRKCLCGHRGTEDRGKLSGHDPWLGLIVAWRRGKREVRWLKGSAAGESNTWCEAAGTYI